MYNDTTSAAAKLPLGDDEAKAIQRLARWMRIVGQIQLAFFSLVLAFLLWSSGCGLMMGGGMVLLIATLIPFAVCSAYVLLSLRLLQAGDQFKNLVDEGDADFLELAFVRLKTVYTIELIAGVLLFIMVFLQK